MDFGVEATEGVTGVVAGLCARDGLGEAGVVPLRKRRTGPVSTRALTPEMSTGASTTIDRVFLSR